MRNRSIVGIVVLTVITFGLYTIYWFATTRGDLNRAGGRIPTTFLLIIPFANFYYLYVFADNFCRIVLKNESQRIGYFLLITLLMPIGVIIYQYHINEILHKILEKQLSEHHL